LEIAGLFHHRSAMRAVLQRVLEASVQVEDRVVGEIGPGILALVGVETGDGPSDAVYIGGKIADLRLFDPAEDGGPERSLREIGGAALVISQFTLLGDCRKGRRPSWSRAAAPDDGRVCYAAVAENLRAQGILVATGEFGAHMQVRLINDGPFTTLLDSRKTF
jgi:D-tyrosyl-tRNA(Tyr) deacylase